MGCLSHEHAIAATKRICRDGGCCMVVRLYQKGKRCPCTSIPITPGSRASAPSIGPGAGPDGLNACAPVAPVGKRLQHLRRIFPQCDTTPQTLGITFGSSTLIHPVDPEELEELGDPEATAPIEPIARSALVALVTLALPVPAHRVREVGLTGSMIPVDPMDQVDKARPRTSRAGNITITRTRIRMHIR